MVRRGRLVALITTFVAVAVLGGAVVVRRDRIAEQWYLWLLESADEEARLKAAEVLGEMKSVKAVPELIRLIEADSRETVIHSFFDTFAASPPSYEQLTMTPLTHALYRIGKDALPMLPSQMKGRLRMLAAVANAIRSASLRVERAPYEFEIFQQSTK